MQFFKFKTDRFFYALAFIFAFNAKVSFANQCLPNVRALLQVQPKDAILLDALKRTISTGKPSQPSPINRGLKLFRTDADTAERLEFVQFKRKEKKLVADFKKSFAADFIAPLFKADPTKSPNVQSYREYQALFRVLSVRAWRELFLSKNRRNLVAQGILTEEQLKLLYEDLFLKLKHDFLDSYYKDHPVPKDGTINEAYYGYLHLYGVETLRYIAKKVKNTDGLEDFHPYIPFLLPIELSEI